MTEAKPSLHLPSCPLCQHPYDTYYHTPRLIPPCGHTYCQKCITNGIQIRSNRKVFTCLECYAEIVIRKSVNDDIPKNISIIDVVKNIRRVNDGKENQKTESHCPEHSLPFELVCQTCQYKSICSHCALFGSHRNHKFCKKAPVSNLDLKQVRQIFYVIRQSMHESIMPQSKSNIKQSMKKQIRDSLKKLISSHFKHYYDIIQKKEMQLLQECEQIQIMEGGIDRTFDKLLEDYERLKENYDTNYTTSINTTFEKIEEFLGKCKQLHQNIEDVDNYADENINKIVREVGVKIKDATIFKIQDVPFSLKKLFENDVGSPSRRQRMKSATSERKVPTSNEKGKAINQRGKVEEPGHFNYVDVQHRQHNKSQYAKKQEKNLKDFELFKQIMAPEQSHKSEISPHVKPFTSNKHIAYNHQKMQQLSKKKNLGMPPRNKPKTVINEPIDPKMSKTMNLKFNPQQPSKITKEVSPAKSTNSKQKSVDKQVNLHDSIPEELKFVRPTKEIPYQLNGKYQKLLKEVDRQVDSNTLELVSQDINDTILLYLLEYLRLKKIGFQMMKMVKNSISDEGFRILLSYLKSDNNTEVINLTSNNLTSKCLGNIITCMRDNHILKTIYLSNNKISPTAIKELRKELGGDVEIVV